MNLQDTIEQYFEQRYGDKRVDKNIYHVSSIIKELDEVIEKHKKHHNGETQTQDYDTSSYYNFYLGELLEETTLPLALNDAPSVLGYKTQASFKHYLPFKDIPQAHLVGNADIQGIDTDGNKFIIEQKTANTWSFNNKKEQATDKHLKQLGAYIALSQAEYGYVWYINKGQGTTATTKLHSQHYDNYQAFRDINVATAAEYEDWLKQRTKQVHREVHETQ